VNTFTLFENLAIKNHFYGVKWKVLESLGIAKEVSHRKASSLQRKPFSPFAKILVMVLFSTAEEHARNNSSMLYQILLR